jgi:hypothetical protein
MFVNADAERSFSSSIGAQPVMHSAYKNSERMKWRMEGFFGCK